MKRIALLLLLPSAALADPRFELGLAAGDHSFSKNVELGVDDDPAEPGPESGALIGVRAALPLTQRFAVESEFMIIPTKDDVLGDHAMVYGLRAHARFDLLTGRFRPFLVAGAGMHILRSTSPQMSNDVDPAFHWGGGVRWALNDTFDIRLDGRQLFVPDRTTNGATSDYEVTAGITYRFGHDPVKALPPPAPVEKVVGDRDGDGIPDDVDKCPDQPEDKDGFQDADGCPDPDNDGDGIPDIADKCPNEPETKNGYQDADGCPDQVIAELAGIGFELDSAKVDAQSIPILDHAFEILQANPSLQVEISGHTSSEGIPARNVELSLARATTVKSYLVKKGIDAGRLQVVGHGSEIPIGDNATDDGRRKNRRIEFKILPAT